jgi:hypothetical protein
LKKGKILYNEFTSIPFKNSDFFQHKQKTKNKRSLMKKFLFKKLMIELYEIEYNSQSSVLVAK